MERPPLEKMRGVVGLDFPAKEIARIIDYALHLESERDAAEQRGYRRGLEEARNVACPFCAVGLPLDEDLEDHTNEERHGVVWYRCRSKRIRARIAALDAKEEK